jgi:Uma2 family endonuclease
MTAPIAKIGKLRLAHLPSFRTAEHPMIMPAIRRRWTTETVRSLTNEQRAWPRYELVRGELVVTPAPGAIHQMAVLEIAKALSQYLDRTPIGDVMVSPADLELEAGSISQPDVFVVPAATDIAGQQLEWSDVKALLLAVEVLSPSSLRIDRVEKRDFYCDVGVPEYWIVDLDAQAVERWTPMRETPEILHDRVVWAPRNGALFSLDLVELFNRIHRIARIRRVP